ncbi:MAG: PspA/IM30 family protein [Oscillospiraceae bacterium]|jgi:phage shock protein A|nr:PspA/IM30 family protein [Oscillospiraceae bacterium]
MAVFERLRDIIESNINALLDRAEDPVKMADQYLLRYRQNLAKARENTARVMAEERRQAQQITDKEVEVDKRLTQAKNALSAGREDLARKAIEEKQRLENELIKLREAHAALSEQVASLEADYNALAGAIRDLEAKRSLIRAKAAVAQSQKATQKAGVTSKSMGSLAESLDRLEGKLDAELEVNRAKAKLDGSPTAGLDELDQFTAASLTADAELQLLKEEMGLA